MSCDFREPKASREQVQQIDCVYWERAAVYAGQSGDVDAGKKSGMACQGQVQCLRQHDKDSARLGAEQPVLQVY
jgi:hypothetical protein